MNTMHDCRYTLNMLLNPLNPDEIEVGILAAAT